MSLLLSSYQPAKFDLPTFSERFNYLINQSERLNIATGYVSEKSLDYLASTIHRQGYPYCNLIIGMHYFDKFTHSQYAAAREMDKFLSENQLGSVKLVTSFPFHGKVYSFKDENGKSTSIIGSSNLNNILDHKSERQYEVDLLIEDDSLNADIDRFMSKLDLISPSISSDELSINSFRSNNNLMEGLHTVTLKTNEFVEEYKKSLNHDKTIRLPLTVSEKSNVNAYFGKGRENKSTKIIRRRPWYEVELIIPKKITELDWYPRYRTIEVLTDDGYEFCCKTSGTNSKNFRSDGDLKILGKWLKGRLESAGVLRVDQRITEETLRQYGRDYITMIPTDKPNKWYLGFDV